MSEIIVIQVSGVETGHEGPYGIVHHDNDSITFSRIDPVWQGIGAKSLQKGDWITIVGTKMHGDPPKKRAIQARLATEEEIRKAQKG